VTRQLVTSSSKNKGRVVGVRVVARASSEDILLSEVVKNGHILAPPYICLLKGKAWLKRNT
jgi:hypothetical protein